MDAQPPVVTPPPVKPGAFVPAAVAVVLPLAAFALSWLIAGKIPLAVPTREWGTWFYIGPLLGVSGIVGLVCAVKAFARGGQRTLGVAGFLLNAMAVLIAWAGLFG
jgi:hypothetical protein